MNPRHAAALNGILQAYKEKAEPGDSLSLEFYEGDGESDGVSFTFTGAEADGIQVASIGASTYGRSPKTRGYREAAAAIDEVHG